MTRNKKKSRREFLSETGGIAAAAAGSGVLGSLVTGCGEALLYPGPDVTAAISGPTELQIPTFGGSVQGVFDSSDSSGPVVGRSWETQKDDFGGGPDDLGEEVTASNDFARPGVHTVRLEVESVEADDTAELDVTVLPPQMPETEYPLIAFFRSERNPEDSNDYSRWDLCLRQGDDTTAVTRLATTGFDPDRLSWEPGGRRIAYAKYGPSAGVFTYDFQTGDTRMLSPRSPLNYDQANVSWGANDWIAYVDWDRTMGGDATGYNLGELVRVRPDGTERTYFSGAVPKLGFQCVWPSWAPDGDRIAVGGHFYDHETHGIVNRVGICENPFEANPTVRNLNSEEQIRAMVEALIPPADVDLFCAYYREGIYGTAWSPDGEWVAYVTPFGPDWLNRILCKSRVDGTGDIEVHATGAVPTHDVIQNPCWSPDGKSMLFSRRNSGNFERWAQSIWMITPETGGIVNLSDDEPTALHEGAAWYGV